MGFNGGGYPPTGGGYTVGPPVLVGVFVRVTVALGVGVRCPDVPVLVKVGLDVGEGLASRGAG